MTVDVLHIINAPGKFVVDKDDSYNCFMKAYALGGHLVGHTEMYEQHTREAFRAACADSGYRPLQPRNLRRKFASTAIAIRKDSPYKVVGTGYEFSIPARSSNLPGAGIGHAERGIVKVTLDIHGRQVTYGQNHFVTGFNMHWMTTKEWYEQLEHAIRFVRSNARGTDMALIGNDPNYRVNDPNTSNKPAEMLDNAGLYSVFATNGLDDPDRRFNDIWAFKRDRRLRIQKVKQHAPRPYKFDHKPRSVWLGIPRLKTA